MENTKGPTNISINPDIRKPLITRRKITSIGTTAPLFSECFRLVLLNVILFFSFFFHYDKILAKEKREFCTFSPFLERLLPLRFSY
jgi:hypothetical protein